MKIDGSISEDLIAFAGKEQLLQAEPLREETQRYLDRHGWDVVDDEPTWGDFQRRRMAEEHSDDEWRVRIEGDWRR